MSDSGQQQQTSCMGSITSYLRTRKGMVIAAEIILCFVILLCYAASRVPGYLTVAVTELVLAIIFFVIFAIKYDLVINFIHWGWTDFLRTAIACVLFLITSLVALIRGGDGAAIAGGVFGLIAGIVFGYDAFLTIPKLRKTHAPTATESPDGV
ncbi:proteolipid protein 2 [Bombina bombina]|uniref:proteolipid protein 2 n=1 Tax=Bombina bombina TaxID=8345 RepID=UPI00235B0A6E|nr:proteolipid protein 2 [Bombina bombina]